jgi:hypothetical protein
MYQRLLRDKAFFAFLFRCDQDLARDAREKGCLFCGGPLHQANFPRKPRGGAIEIGSPEALRLSFCCGREDCRKRVTPPSLRFLGRRVYLAAAVALLAAMDGASGAALARFADVSQRTLRRWRRWWREIFPHTRLWIATCGRLRQPIASRDLPGGLLAAFAGDLEARLLAFLRWLAPLTGGPGLFKLTGGTAGACRGTQRTPAARAAQLS